MKTLIEFNGMFFNEGTPGKVMRILSNNLHKNRLRFWYGFTEGEKAGKSWNEENDIIGYIGKTTGPKKVPILLHNINSIFGGAILTDCIVKIVDINTNTVLYEHENFNQSVFVAEGCKVLQDGGVFAPKCKNEKSAQRLADFMNGKRNNK